MVKRIILSALFAAVAANAQTYGLMPDFPQQFTDNNGNPLAGGFIVSCVAGLSCAYPIPANPQATFTSSSGFTANPDPIPLDASGRANIWLNTALIYKLVLVNSAGVIIKTVDNVTAPSSGGGSTTNYWTLSGTTISNNNGAGAGDVAIGGGLTVSNDVTVDGSLKLRDADSTANYAFIRAANVMAADVSWRWPAVDAPGCLTSNGIGVLTFTACSGGGGGGSPGGNVSDVQFNNTTFGGSDNFTWNNASQVAVITAASNMVPGLVVLTGYAQSDVGFLAVNNASPGTALQYNAIQVPTGGMHALSFTADKYVQIGHNTGTPTVSGGDTFVTGAMYCDTTTMPCVPNLYDGMGWVALATGGATSPGGATTNVQINSGGSFAGSSNLVFSAQRLTVIGSSSSLPAIYAATGYVQSDAGFLATPGSATRYNVIQAPAGGMAANSFTATTYTQVGNSAGPFSSAPPTPTSTDTFHPGALSYSIADGNLQVYNGTTWGPIGGGSGSPGGVNTSVQYNNSGSFAGSANFEWNNGARQLLVNGIAGTADIVALGGWVQSDTGFVAVVNGSPGTALNFNAIQAPTGGVFAKSFRATLYTQVGAGGSIPALTAGDAFQPGAMYYDTIIGAPRVYNGSTWVNLATGGIPSLNSLTGAINIVGTVNQVSVASSGTTITLSTPQNINTNSNVNFGSVTSPGTITSNVAGASLAFAGTNFAVNGNGVVNVMSLQVLGGAGNGVNVTGNNAANSIQTIGGANLCISSGCSSGAALQVAGSTVINSSGGGTFTGLFSSGGLTVIGSVAVTGNVNSAGYQASGTPGITSNTCSHWTLGLCTSP